MLELSVFATISHEHTYKHKGARLILVSWRKLCAVPSISTSVCLTPSICLQPLNFSDHQSLLLTN